MKSIRQQYHGGSQASGPPLKASTPPAVAAREVSDLGWSWSSEINGDLGLQCRSTKYFDVRRLRRSACHGLREPNDLF